MVVTHPLDVVRRGPELRRYRREEAGGVPEGHDLVVPTVYDEGRTPHVPRALLVVEEVPDHPEIETVEVGHDLVHAEEGRVEDEPPDRLSGQGGLGGEVARRSGSEGAAVQHDPVGGYLPDARQVPVGGLDVAVYHILARSLVPTVVIAGR